MGAAAFGFLTLIQLFERPDRYGASRFFRHDAFQAEIAHRCEHFSTMTLSVFNVLNAAFDPKSNLAKRGLALAERAPPQIVAIEHQQIESRQPPRNPKRGCARHQNAFGIKTNHLSVDDG